MRKTRAITAVMALLAAPAAGCIAGSTPAAASASQCTGGANGFEDIADSYAYGDVQRTVPLAYGATVYLMSDDFGWFDERGYARLGGPDIAGARVWMDWTRNYGSSKVTWIQCGPFGPSSGSPLTTPAQATSDSSAYRFRACGDIPSQGISAKCSTWW